MLKLVLFGVLIAVVLPTQSSAGFTIRLKRMAVPHPTRSYFPRLPSRLCEQGPFGVCGYLVPNGKLTAIQGVPSTEELEEVCPEFLKFINCATEFIEECPIRTSNEKLLFSQFDFIKKICDPHTAIYSRYQANAECLKKLDTLEVGNKCTGSEESAFKLSKTPSPLLLMPHISELLNKNSGCVESSSSLACVATEVEKACGEEAFLLVLDIIRDLKIVETTCSLPSKVEAKGVFYSSTEIKKGAPKVTDALHNILKRRSF